VATDGAERRPRAGELSFGRIVADNGDFSGRQKKEKVELNRSKRPERRETFPLRPLTTKLLHEASFVAIASRKWVFLSNSLQPT